MHHIYQKASLIALASTILASPSALAQDNHFKSFETLTQSSTSKAEQSTLKKGEALRPQSQTLKLKNIYNEEMQKICTLRKSAKAYIEFLESDLFKTFAISGLGSLDDAKTQLEEQRNLLNFQQTNLEHTEKQLAKDKVGSWQHSINLERKQILLTIISGIETKIAYWSGEVKRMTPLHQKYKNLRKAAVSSAKKIKDLKRQYDRQYKTFEKEQAALNKKIQEERKTKYEAIQKAYQTEKKQLNELAKHYYKKHSIWPTQEEAKTISLNKISPNKDTYRQTQEEAYKRKRPKAPQTHQDVSNWNEADIFNDLAWKDASYKIINAIDVTGQKTKTMIGIVSNIDSADAILPETGDLTQAIGKSMAHGIPLKDAVVSAALNAGYAGALSMIGNKLTSNADKLANHIAIVSDVAFSKLKTKQIAEMKTKGITFIVIKTTQAINAAQAKTTSHKVTPKKDKTIDAKKKVIDTPTSSSSDLNKTQQAKTLYILGTEQLKTGHPDKALNAFEKAEKLTTQNPDLLLKKSEALRKLGYYRKAWNTALASKKIKPHHIAAYQEGLALIAMGVGKQAVRVLRTAVTEKPNNTDYQEAYGQALLLFGEYGMAEKILTRVLQKDAWRVKTYLFRAMAWRGIGDEAKARADLTMAAHIAPDDPAVRSIYKRSRWNKKELNIKTLIKKAKAHSAAIKTAPILSTLSKNTEVEVQKCLGDWCRIEANGSFKGYIPKANLK